MARIFDPTTREEIQLPEAELNEAVASGKATFAANDLINVIAPDGSSGTIPATKIKDAITQGGFKIESPLQQAVREHVEKNDTLSGSVKVGLDQFANQALFGVPGIIGDKYKNPLEKLKDDAVKDDHQIANAIGGVTGFGASLFAGGPLFKGATKAGTLAEKAVASGLAEVGIKRGAQNIAADLAARVAENATRLGVESAILSTPQAGAHLINGDPELAAETLISNGVLGLGLGTLGGALSTGGSRLKKAFGKSALEGEALNAAKTIEKQTITSQGKGKFTAEGTIETPLSKDIIDDSIIANAGDKPGMFSKITQEMKSLKKNVDEIKTASEALGIEPTEGMVSGSKFIQDMDSALTKKVSMSGISRAKKYEKIYDTLENNVREAFATNAPESALAAGDQIKGIIRKGVEDRYTPFNEAYAQIREVTGGLKIPLEELNTLNKDLSNFAKTQYKKFQPKIDDYAAQVLEKEGSADNLETIFRYVKDDITEANRAGRYEEMKILEKVRDKIKDFSDEAIAKQARKLQKMGVPSATTFLENKEMVNKGYKEFKGLMETLSGTVKVRGHGIKDVLESLDDVASEKLVDRLFDKKNARAMQFMQKEFPEAFDIVKGFKKRQIIEKTIKDDKVGLGQVFNSTKDDKLSSEIKSLIFTPEQLKKFDQSRVVFESIPKDVNPSGTARGLDFQEFFNPLSPKSYVKIGGEFITDKIQEQIMSRATDAYKTNGSIINAATRSMAKLNRIPEALNNFISKRIPVTLEGSSVSAIQRFLGTETKSREEQIQELNEKLGEFNENPALATEHMSNTTRQVPENIAAAVTAKNVAIAQYLGSHIPKPRAIPNPFNQNKWKPSDSEISRFERRVQAVENPLSIVDQLETGTLSKETVETVQTLYPKLYEMVQQKVVESMQNHKGPIPYSARIKLSLLMGENFDNSLKPENIRMMQQRFAQKPVQPQKTSGNMNLPSLETQSQRISSR